MNDTAVVAQAREALQGAGLRGSFLVRDLDSGQELGIDADLLWPVASLVKVPIAVATLERAARGELDPSAPVTVEPGRVSTPGPTGLSRFRHPATIALEDLVYLAVAVSDSTAADALLALTPPAQVTAELRRLGLAGISVRHLMRELASTPAELFDPGEVHVAHSLAIAGATPTGGHAVAQLDIARANTGSARALTDLLQALWQPSAVHPAVAERVRELMGATVMRHRLAPDFSSDASLWSSKTGSLLNLRHEIGVVEHADGQTFAIAALTESSVAAAVQPEAEALMAHVARMLRDQLRRFDRL
ncbi:serine hydrolase [Catellatospora tritici]|uniref:serine hydrolase n=1 Tax=Catellatospora tritici TaxID=2851566 RepID=UPI001C2DC8EE|nr:serine hydrolase [Catellatospora tritici]MBV1856389.1 class A beta-lactamase-related serine hydrolase [Catellatospora tritici]